MYPVPSFIDDASITVKPLFVKLVKYFDLYFRLASDSVRQFLRNSHFENFPVLTQVVHFEIQRKVAGRAAFGASLSNEMLGRAVCNPSSTKEKVSIFHQMLANGVDEKYSKATPASSFRCIAIRHAVAEVLHSQLN